MYKKQRLTLKKILSSKFLFRKNVDIIRDIDNNCLKIYLAVHNFKSAEWRPLLG